MGDNQYFEDGKRIKLYVILPNHVFYLTKNVSGNIYSTKEYKLVTRKLTFLRPDEYLYYNIHYRWDGSIKDRILETIIIILLLYVISENYTNIKIIIYRKLSKFISK